MSSHNVKVWNIIVILKFYHLFKMWNNVSIKEIIMHCSSFRTPSVDNLYILAESTFLSFALAANKTWNKQVVDIQVE